jgi:hypothetical protein
MFTLPPIDADGRIAKSLRPVRAISAVLAVTVALVSVLSWVLLEGLAIHRLRGIPTAVPVSMTAFSMILLLLASRMRSNIVRKAIPSTPGLPMSFERLLEGYRRATLISFLMLECAALTGFAVALLTGTAFYGMVLGAASLISMATRWPRVTDFDRIASGKRSP